MKLQFSKITKNQISFHFVSFETQRIAVVYLYYFCTVFSFNFRSPKSQFKKARYNLKYWWRKTKENAVHQWRMRFDKKPVYYSVWSRDCDMCESTDFCKHDTYADYHNMLNDPEFYGSFEGATSIDIISKERYDDNCNKPRIVRDRVMEAFENGNGTSFYV